MSKEFKPYIPADRVLPEITKTSVIMGVLLAVFAVCHIDKLIDLSGVLDTGQIGAVILLLVMCGTVLAAAAKGRKKVGTEEEAE